MLVNKNVTFIRVVDDVSPKAIKGDVMISKVLKEGTNNHLYERYHDFHEALINKEHTVSNFSQRSCISNIFSQKKQKYTFSVSVGEYKSISIGLLGVFLPKKTVEDTIQQFLDHKFSGWFFEQSFSKGVWGKYGGDLTRLVEHLSYGEHASVNNITAKSLKFDSLEDTKNFIQENSNYQKH